MKETSTIESTLLYTEKQTAALLNISVKTLQKWRLQGKKPYYIKLSNRLVRYRKQDIENFVSENHRNSTSDKGTGTEG
jgi:predicted site-specific integrase-resolvase